MKNLSNIANFREHFEVILMNKGVDVNRNFRKIKRGIALSKSKCLKFKRKKTLKGTKPMRNVDKMCEML